MVCDFCEALKYRVIWELSRTMPMIENAITQKTIESVTPPL